MENNPSKIDEDNGVENHNYSTEKAQVNANSTVKDDVTDVDTVNSTISDGGSTKDLDKPTDNDDVSTGIIAIATEIKILSTEDNANSREIKVISTGDDKDYAYVESTERTKNCQGDVGNPSDVHGDMTSTENGNPSENDGNTESTEDNENPKKEEVVSTDDIGNSSDQVAFSAEDQLSGQNEEEREPMFASMREITDSSQWINDLMDEFQVNYRRGKKKGGFPSLPLRRPDLLRVRLTDIICSSPWHYFEKPKIFRTISPLVMDSTFKLVCRNGLEPEAASQRLKNGRMSKIPVFKRSRPNTHTGNTSPPVSMSHDQCEDENGPQSESPEQARENNDIEVHKEERSPVSVPEDDQKIETGRRSKSPKETVKSDVTDIQRELNSPVSISVAENKTENVEKTNVSIETMEISDAGSEAGIENTCESSIGSKRERIYTFPRDKHVPSIRDSHNLGTESAQGSSLRKRMASLSPIPVLANKPRIKMENLENPPGSNLSCRSSLTHLSGLPSKPKIPVGADQTKGLSDTERSFDRPKGEKSKLPVPKVRTSPVQNKDFNKGYEGSGRSLQKRETRIPADEHAGKIIDVGKVISDGDRDKTRPGDSNMAKNSADMFIHDVLTPNSSPKIEESPQATPRACRKEVSRTAIQHSSYLDMHRRRLISRQEKDERSNIRPLNTNEGTENVATISTKYGNYIPHPPTRSYGYGKAFKADKASRELLQKKITQQKKNLSQRPPWNAPAAVRSKWEAQQRKPTEASTESQTPRSPKQISKPEWNVYKPLPDIPMSGGMKRTPSDRKIVAEAKPNIANVMNKKAVLPAIGSRCDDNANIIREEAAVDVANDTMKIGYEVKGSSPSMEVVATGTESDAITPTSGRVSKIPVLFSGPGNGRSRPNSAASTSSSTPVNINDNSRTGFSSTSLSSLSSVSLRGFMRVTPEDIDYARLYCAKYADMDFVYFKIMPNLCNGQIVPYLDLWCIDDDFMRAKAMMLKYCRRPSEPSAPAPLGFQMKRTDTQINRWCSSAKGKIILNDQLDCSAVIYRPIGREQIRKTFYGYHSYGGHQFEENLLARSGSSIQGSPVVERINRTPFELLDYLSVSSDKTPSSFCSCSGPVPVLSSSDSSSFCRPDSGSLNSSQRYTGGPVTESVTIDVRASSENEEPVKNDSILKRIKRFFFPRV